MMLKKVAPRKGRVSRNKNGAITQQEYDESRPARGV